MRGIESINLKLFADGADIKRHCNINFRAGKDGHFRIIS